MTPPSFPHRLGSMLFGLILTAHPVVAETLFVATPLTRGDFTAGIGGPACDREGNIDCVRFREARNIARVTPGGRAELFVELPGTGAGNGIRSRHGKGTIVKLSPSGDVLREVGVLGERPNNLCVGGPDGCTVYVTEATERRRVQFRVDRPGLEWQRNSVSGPTQP